MNNDAPPDACYDCCECTCYWTRWVVLLVLCAVTGGILTAPLSTLNPGPPAAGEPYNWSFRMDDGCDSSAAGRSASNWVQLFVVPPNFNAGCSTNSATHPYLDYLGLLYGLAFVPPVLSLLAIFRGPCDPLWRGKAGYRWHVLGAFWLVGCSRLSLLGIQGASTPMLCRPCTDARYSPFGKYLGRTCDGGGPNLQTTVDTPSTEAVIISQILPFCANVTLVPNGLDPYVLVPIVANPDLDGYVMGRRDNVILRANWLFFPAAFLILLLPLDDITQWTSDVWRKTRSCIAAALCWSPPVPISPPSA